MLSTVPVPPTPDGKDFEGRDYVNVDKERYLMFASQLLSVLPRPKQQDHPPRLLDVGCGAGFVVKVASGVGFDAVGIDTYGEAVSYAKNILKTPVIKINLYDFKVGKKFDVISLNHVFEHITETDKFLKKIKSLMSKNGVLLLSSPNYKSLMRLIFGDRWYGFQALQHVWQLTPETLTRYLESQGFTDIKFYRSTLDYNPTNKVKNLIFRIMNFFALKLNLGDQLVMTASKRAE